MIVYDIDYLVSSELTDDDLYNLLDCGSLIYSLIIGMYRFASIDKSDSDIIAEVGIDNSWIEKNSWTKKQLLSYEKKLIKVYQNLYQYSYEKSSTLAQWWIIQYGLSVR